MIPYAIHILSSLVLKRACGADYLYYRTPSPWLQIKLLRFLQYYPDLMSSGQTYVPTLKQILARILNDTDVSDSINKSNACEPYCICETITRTPAVKLSVPHDTQVL